MYLLRSCQLRILPHLWCLQSLKPETKLTSDISTCSLLVSTTSSLTLPNLRTPDCNVKLEWLQYAHSKDPPTPQHLTISPDQLVDCFHQSDLWGWPWQRGCSSCTHLRWTFSGVGAVVLIRFLILLGEQPIILISISPWLFNPPRGPDLSPKQLIALQGDQA